MELTSGFLSSDEYVPAVKCSIAFLHAVGVKDILVAFGYGCECPSEQRYEYFSMPLERLQPFIEESEAENYYLRGTSDLLIKSATGEIEFLFCHESDIHFISANAKFVDRLIVEWQSAGLSRMYQKDKGDWELVVTTS